MIAEVYPSGVILCISGMDTRMNQFLNLSDSQSHNHAFLLIRNFFHVDRIAFFRVRM